MHYTGRKGKEMRNEHGLDPGKKLGHISFIDDVKERGSYSKRNGQL